jgi:hypothetical protein
MEQPAERTPEHPPGPPAAPDLHPRARRWLERVRKALILSARGMLLAVAAFIVSIVFVELGEHFRAALYPAGIFAVLGSLLLIAGTLGLLLSGGAYFLILFFFYTRYSLRTMLRVVLTAGTCVSVAVIGGTEVRLLSLMVLTLLAVYLAQSVVGNDPGGGVAKWVKVQARKDGTADA